MRKISEVRLVYDGNYSQLARANWWQRER